MRILAVGLAHSDQLFVEGSPPKGAWFFLQPDLECARLASLARPEDTFVYADLRTEPIDRLPVSDLTVVSVGFGHEETARVLASRLARAGRNAVNFGPAPTLWRNTPPEWCRHHVVGDILNAWPDLMRDAAQNSLRPRYDARGEPRHVPARLGLGRWPLMNAHHQRMSFTRGCSCPASVRGLCPEFLYHGTKVALRTREEICGEVLTMPGKHIELLDDDIASHPDYYLDMFRRLWTFRRHWTVNAGIGLFEHRELVELMSKAGTKVIRLNESFAPVQMTQTAIDEYLIRRLRRGVRLLHSRRMLVGARLTFTLDPDSEHNFVRLGRELRHLDLDFIEVRFVQREHGASLTWVPVRYEPEANAADPVAIKVAFYTWGAILDRIVRRPRRVGFYTTLVYLLRRSLSYRQNLLEGAPYP